MTPTDHRGTGILCVGSDEFEVTYGLTTTENTGGGQIIGDHQALYAALLADDVTLALKDGRIAPILVTDYGVGMGVAEYKLSGAIVGPAKWIG